MAALCAHALTAGSAGSLAIGASERRGRRAAHTLPTPRESRRAPRPARVVWRAARKQPRKKEACHIKAKLHRKSALLFATASVLF